jgi:hypothetical protein
MQKLILLVLALCSIPGIDQESIEMLGNGNSLHMLCRGVNRREQNLHYNWWYLANHVAPNYVLLADYSYAILTSKEDDRKTKDEIELLERQMKNAVFRSGLEKQWHLISASILTSAMLARASTS